MMNYKIYHFLHESAVLLEPQPVQARLQVDLKEDKQPAPSVYIWSLN